MNITRVQLVSGKGKQLRGCEQIAAGSESGLALTKDGSIYQWRYDREVFIIHK